MKIELYTDGACSKNGKIGAVAGWAWCLVVNDERVADGAGRIEDGTNNQGELMAIIAGLTYIVNSENYEGAQITVTSDSAYCINGITNWVYNWMKNNWYRNKAQTEEVKNKEYWQELYELSQQLCVNYQWCKGHAGNTYNEIVDKLAQAQTK